jgi:hypothetical protein
MEETNNWQLLGWATADIKALRAELVMQKNDASGDARLVEDLTMDIESVDEMLWNRRNFGGGEVA